MWAVRRAANFDRNNMVGSVHGFPFLGDVIEHAPQNLVIGQRRKNRVVKVRQREGVFYAYTYRKDN